MRTKRHRMLRYRAVDQRLLDHAGIIQRTRDARPMTECAREDVEPRVPLPESDDCPDDQEEYWRDDPELDHRRTAALPQELV